LTTNAHPEKSLKTLRQSNKRGCHFSACLHFFAAIRIALERAKLLGTLSARNWRELAAVEANVRVPLTKYGKTLSAQLSRPAGDNTIAA
jgi:hypothetical protein